MKEKDTAKLEALQAKLDQVKADAAVGRVRFKEVRKAQAARDEQLKRVVIRGW